MTLRDLLDQIAAIRLSQGGAMPVMNEEGLELVGLEYNDDEEPCVLLMFGEDD